MRVLVFLAFLGLTVAFASKEGEGVFARSAEGVIVYGQVLQDTDGSRTKSDGDRPAITIVDLERRVGEEVAWFVTLYTDRDGRYTFTDVPPGDYAVIASWPQQFVSPPTRPQSRVPAAEWGFHVQAGTDFEVPPFVVQDLGSNAPSPAEDRDLLLIPFVGSRSVAGQMIPAVPEAPGLTQRITLPEGAQRLIVSRQRGRSESHVARRDDNRCIDIPVTSTIIEITPRFSVTCPPNIRVSLAVSFGELREGPPGFPDLAPVFHGLTLEPPLEWRLPNPGERTRVLSARVTPPNVGDAGLR